MFKIVEGDITKANVGAIVNASNGVGYMGGERGIDQKLPGVAEAIHYATKGTVEKEAKQACRKSKFLPRYLCGHKPGEIFVTSAGNLNAVFIFHAVTMKYPGMKADEAVVGVLLRKIIDKARELGVRSIAIPLLGTGTGGLFKEKVIEEYKQVYNGITGLDITLYLYKG